LEPDVLCGLSLRLLADLKEARERLNQGPTNSTRPPSSRAPWERGEAPALPDEPAIAAHDRARAEPGWRRSTAISSATAAEFTAISTSPPATPSPPA